MAQYETKCTKCGQKGIVHLFGKHTERQKALEWGFECSDFDKVCRENREISDARMDE